MTSLPSQFFLYFPNRQSSTDPHSGFVLVDAVKDGAAWRITPCPPSLTEYTLAAHPSPSIPSMSATYNVHHSQTAGLILLKTFFYYSDIAITGPAPVPVIEMGKHTTVFSSHLKRNVRILGTAPAPAPQPKVTGTLSLHVARQLLELARMKRETCPIIMEDLMEGHTAVMPCGHLFSQLAIEESFKKEASRCPACRQLGTPTYV